MRTDSGDGGRRAPGELEAEVLGVLWEADEPLSAGEVQQRLPGELAYTTVVTILSRLYDKGVLIREKRGRSFAYQAVEDEAGLAARRMRSVLDREPDRGSVLARFVSGLSKSDERVLLDLLHRHGADEG
ncbi:BlaI/MecI/CopY family transcriptional regulator [Amycolatopsis taiwanensis]|uniref:BlaI/MecI/CopY family transcriptional regulator n=1 Tax=Amycolatopsis taiwanensis TaxID=342230 RepID=UPI000480E8F8|nr:BlaI/MecI/CopY family transcriptional regulator [Amycolatopsis taiwanensis]